MKRNLTLILLWLGLLPSLSACADRYPPTYSAEAISATVIDADTRKPLAGVVVTANWQLLGGMEGNYPVGQLEVLETVTDANGRFHFPAWGPKKRIKGYLREDDPQLLLFKPGYEYRRLANEVSSRINYDSVRRSVWNGKVIELKRFGGTGEGYAEHVYRLDGNLDRMRDGEQCEWKSIPRMLVALHHMRERFDAEGIKVPGWQIGARIRKVIDVGNQKQCGSAQEYFRNYLP